MANGDGYTKFPNWLLDEALPNCDPNEWRVICAIVRETTGWGRGCVKLSISELRRKTGIGGKSTLINAITGVIKLGYISRVESGMSYEYQLTSPEIGLVLKQDMSQNRTRTSPEIGLEPVTKQDYLPPVLNKERKLKKEEDIYIPPLPAEMVAMINALTKATKTKYGAGFNEDKFEQAAAILLRDGITIEQVEGFPGYWRDLGWGGSRGLPTLEKVVEEMDNCIRRVDTRPKQSLNGKHTPERPVTIDPTMPKPGQGGVW